MEVPWRVAIILGNTLLSLFVKIFYTILYDIVHKLIALSWPSGSRVASEVYAHALRRLDLMRAGQSLLLGRADGKTMHLAP